VVDGEVPEAPVVVVVGPAPVGPDGAPSRPDDRFDRAPRASSAVAVRAPAVWSFPAEPGPGSGEAGPSPEGSVAAARAAAVAVAVAVPDAPAAEGSTVPELGDPAPAERVEGPEPDGGPEPGDAPEPGDVPAPDPAVDPAVDAAVDPAAADGSEPVTVGGGEAAGGADDDVEAAGAAVEVSEWGDLGLWTSGGGEETADKVVPNSPPVSPVLSGFGPVTGSSDPRPVRRVLSTRLTRWLRACRGCC
jgi:hypothetical protein